MKSNLMITSSPHFRIRLTTRMVMRDVLIALCPAMVASAVIFGWKALAVCLVCVASSVGFEYLYGRFVSKEYTISDLSAAVTGLIIALNLPVSIPLWMAAIGCFVAIVVVKQLFGGLGKNFANPAIVGRIVLMLSFTTAMTQWQLPVSRRVAGVVTGATPLAMATVPADKMPTYLQLFLGDVGGSLGETCKLALILGFAYLLIRKLVTPSAPLAYIGSVLLLSWAVGMDPLYQVLSGGLMLGAFFMATDYVTTPINESGKFAFGVGCGIITVVIRRFGGSPEGVSYAILLMNICTPHIDRLTRTHPFGAARRRMTKGDVVDAMVRTKQSAVGPTVILASVCLLITAALAGTYISTRERIAAIEQEAANQVRSELLPAAGGVFTPIEGIELPDGVLEAHKAGGDAGYVFKAQSKGYNGQVPVMVALDNDGNIIRIEVLQNSESPGVGSRVAERSNLDKYVGRKNGEGVDNVAGASITTAALKDSLAAIEKAFDMAKGEA